MHRGPSRASLHVPWVTDRAPHSLGRYEIQREIGRGMMGVVYEAVDPALGRTIALKTIEIGFTLSPEEHESFEQRFLVEARIAARLSHPNIVLIHDVGRDASTGTLFMALEYLEGRTLAEVIKRGPPLDWREALRITARLAEALDHAHSHGVIHRDIKPGNVMLLPTGDPKIMDFGIAKVETARIQLTMAGQSFGTPLYMSPEQALGEAVDRTTDIFSLGSIAYSLLAGRPAFWAESIPRIVARVAQDDPPPPSQFAPGLPARVDRVIARAMAKKASERYASGKEMAEEIEGVLDLDRLLEGHMRPQAGRAMPTVDIDAQLAKLVEGASAPATPGVRASPVTRTRAHPRKLLAWGLGLPLVGLGAFLVWLLVRSGSGPETERPRSASPSASEAAKAKPARLSVELEHSMNRGLVRIWVDRELVAEGRLDSDTPRTITAFDFRRGGMREFLELPPGDHDVEVQVLWDGKEKTDRIWGHFDAGSTRRVRAKLGGIIKRLSLEWE